MVMLKIIGKLIVSTHVLMETTTGHAKLKYS